MSVIPPEMLRSDSEDLATVYPAGSPNRFDDWDKMLADFDRAIGSIIAALSDAAAHPKAVLPGVVGHARQQVEAIDREFRHVVRYARDAESGNERLRRDVAAADVRNEEIHTELGERLIAVTVAADAKVAAAESRAVEAERRAEESREESERPSDGVGTGAQGRTGKTGADSSLDYPPEFKRADFAQQFAVCFHHVPFSEDCAECPRQGTTWIATTELESLRSEVASLRRVVEAATNLRGFPSFVTVADGWQTGYRQGEAALTAALDALTSTDETKEHESSQITWMEAAMEGWNKFHAAESEVASLREALEQIANNTRYSMPKLEAIARDALTSTDETSGVAPDRAGR